MIETPRSKLVRPGLAVLVGVIVGLVGAVPVVAHLGADPPAELDLHHNPPLIANPGEAVEVAVGFTCPGADGTDCLPEGTVTVRPLGGDTWERVALEGPRGDEWLLRAAIPETLVSPPGFEYFVEVAADDTEQALPSTGAHGPLRVSVTPPGAAVSVELPQDATFAEARSVWQAGWGDGPGQVGLHEGNESPRIGPSSFEVLADGTVAVYDPVHRELLLDGPNGREFIPSPTRASFVDVAADGDGNVFMLELVPGGDRSLELFRLAPASAAIEQLGTAAEGVADQLRSAGGAVYAHQYPSDSWRPLIDTNGVAVAREDQHRAAQPGRPLSGSDEALLKVDEDVVRVAIASDSAVTRTFEVRGAARFGEAQLADVLADGSLVLVVRQVDQGKAWFRMVRISPSGSLLWDRSAPTGDWAESAPVSRFRLDATGSLHQMRSSPSGVEIVAYDMRE